MVFFYYYHKNPGNYTALVLSTSQTSLQLPIKGISLCYLQTCRCTSSIQKHSLNYKLHSSSQPTFKLCFLWAFHCKKFHSLNYVPQYNHSLFPQLIKFVRQLLLHPDRRILLFHTSFNKLFHVWPPAKTMQLLNYFNTYQIISVRSLFPIHFLHRFLS